MQIKLFKILLFIQIFFVFSTLKAQVPTGYYDNTNGLNGEALKTALYNIIKGHTERSYTDLWTDFQKTDVKTNGKVWDMYSDIPGSTPPYEFTFISDQCGNYSGEGSCFNREHSFPKSWFASATPMYSDLFHIVPTDGYVNSKRSNYPYGEVSSPTWTSQNGSKLGSCSYSGYTGTVFEPIDDYKGDFARIYFYMATRYENLIASWQTNTTESDAILDGTSFPCFETWFLNMLIEWDTNDPVSQKEINRNDSIYTIQGNRNPYIDHPEYVGYVWGGQNSSGAPIISNITISPANPNETDSVTVSANITDDGSITSAIMKWGTNDTNFPNSINMAIQSGDTYTTSTKIPQQSATTIIFYFISVEDNEANVINSDTSNYTIVSLSQSYSAFFQGFENSTDDTWNYTGGESSSIAARTGSGALQGANGDEIIFDNIDISTLSDVKVIIHDASSGGIENADALEIYINLNEVGYPASSDITIQEANPTDGTYNVSWDYSATGTASTIAGTPTTFNGDGTNGYATIEISIPNGTSSLAMKIIANSNKPDEYFHIDDIKISGTGTIENPDSFIVTPVSNSQINLSWSLNTLSQNVLLATNVVNSFSKPVDGQTYSASDILSDGETIIYTGNETSFNHTGLIEGVQYFYKLWSIDTNNNYSTGIISQGTTLYLKLISQSNDLLLCSGDTATFSVVAEGTEPIIYQWKKNGIDINSTNTSVFSIYPVTQADTGAYTCFISNVFDTLITNIAYLTVDYTEIPVGTDEAVCYNNEIPTLYAEGVNINWYADADLTNFMVEGNYYLSEESNVGDYFYYVTQTINNCESEAIIVQLSILENPEPPITHGVTGCEEAILNNLIAEGENITWYKNADLTGLLGTGNEYTPIETDAGTYTYYATQTIGDCKSNAASVDLIIYPKPAPPVATDIDACSNDDSFEVYAEGNNINWYADSDLIELLGSGNVYDTLNLDVGLYYFYAVQLTEECISLPDTVILTVYASPDAPISEDLETCIGEDSIFLMATGTNIQWYNDIDLNNLLTANDSLFTEETDANTYTYFVTQSVNNCQSEPLEVVLTINPLPFAIFDYSTDFLKVTFENYSEYTDSTLWDFGDGIISYEESPIHFYEEPNDYTVKLTVWNKCGTDSISNIILVETFINETYNRKINIFPNPLNNKLILEGLDGVEKIIILDAFGRKSLEKLKPKFRTKINTQDFSKGIYFIQIIYMDNSMQVYKIVK